MVIAFISGHLGQRYVREALKHIRCRSSDHNNNDNDKYLYSDFL